jgi:hypothetical protein
MLEEEEEVPVRPVASMSPLVVVTEGKSQEVCVGGRTREGGEGEGVILYVEVERTNQFTGLPYVTLQYDVEFLDEASVADPMQGKAYYKQFSSFSVCPGVSVRVQLFS